MAVAPRTEDRKPRRNVVRPGASVRSWARVRWIAEHEHRDMSTSTRSSVRTDWRSLAIRGEW